MAGPDIPNGEPDPERVAGTGAWLRIGRGNETMPPARMRAWDTQTRAHRGLGNMACRHLGSDRDIQVWTLRGGETCMAGRKFRCIVRCAAGNRFARRGTSTLCLAVSWCPIVLCVVMCLWGRLGRRGGAEGISFGKGFFNMISHVMITSHKRKFAGVKAVGHVRCCLHSLS